MASVQDVIRAVSDRNGTALCGKEDRVSRQDRFIAWTFSDGKANGSDELHRIEHEHEHEHET